VWFDSGVSHYSVLEQYPDLKWPADLYLEGYDQHRGWFQTSLLTAVPLKGEAPFASVLSHGFVLDESGRAMSKSVGNVIDPLKVVGETGADVLRLALLMSDFTADIQVGQNILNQASEIYKKIRNTFRFMEGNLFDFKDVDAVPFDEMKAIDRWILARWSEMKKRLSASFDAYEFYSFVSIFHSFCVKELSSIYLDAIKSRLYMRKPGHKDRRSAQTALAIMAKEFPILIAPILTFTAEEMWQALRSHDLVSEESVYLVDWPDVDFELSDKENDFWENALELREKANELMEKLRQNKEIGHSLDASVTIYGSGADFLSPAEWSELLVVSSAEVHSDGKEWDVEVNKAEGEKCARCWRIREDVGLDDQHPEICGECLDDITG
jgi:isoleucyl-tRNA synthetase